LLKRLTLKDDVTLPNSQESCIFFWHHPLECENLFFWNFDLSMQNSYMVAKKNEPSAARKLTPPTLLANKSKLADYLVAGY